MAEFTFWGFISRVTSPVIYVGTKLFHDPSSRVLELVFRVQDSGLRAQVLGSRIQDSLFDSLLCLASSFGHAYVEGCAAETN